MAIVVGKIIGIKGTVRVFNTETQEMRVVEEGAEIFLDEVVITEDGATVAIATVDGNTISLGGSSEFVIDNDSVPVAALRELPDAIIGNFESLQAAIIDGNFESVTDAGTTLADEQVDLLRSQAETINTNNEAEELSSSNQEGVEDERNAETGEVTAGYVTETREIDLEEAAEATDDAVDEVAVNTPEPETEPDPETEPEPDPDPETTPDPEVDPDPVNVIIRLIALDDTQVPILDENGHYTLANTVLEGNDGNYMALAFASDATEFSPATRLEDQQGSVSITFGNLSAVGSDSQTTDDGSQDFNNTPILTISLDIPFNTGTYDDYLSDGGEQYTVTILPTSFVDPNETYTDVIIDESPVITTIIDDGQPNTPFDPNDPVEPNMESVRVVLVPTDAAGNIIDPVTIPEGETAYFKVILLDPNGNEIPNATGDVDVVFTDGTAVRTGTSEDAELDFAANNQTVSINQVFSADALGDYLSDSGETFDVAIVDGTYSDAERYENVEHDLTPVTTTIIDDGQPNTPFDPNDPVEPNTESVRVVLVPTDAAGNIIDPVTIPEGETAYFKVILLDPNGNEIPNATGDVDIVFTDGTAVRTGSSEDAELDFAANNQTVAINQVFSADALDDYLSDSGETFDVAIVDGTYSDATRYENVEHDLTPVTTTIIDDGQPNTPFDPNDPVEPDMESVRVVLVPTDAAGNIIDPVTIPEGETAYFKVILLDPNGNEIPNATGEVDIVFTDGTAVRTGTSDDGELDFSANNQTVAINQVFSADALDDYLSDSGETFDVAIVDGTYSDAERYENVEHDLTPVTTTIIDDGQPNTPFDPNDPVEPNTESVRVVLVPTDAAGNIIDPVTIPEGETAYFKVILLDPNGNEIPNATGDVDIVFTDGTAVRTGTSEDAELDFAANNQTVAINQVFSADALDDYLSDSGETFDVAIVDGTYSDAERYENVEHDLTPVTTTIIDDGQPNTPFDPNDPVEPNMESVRVVLVPTDAAGNIIDPVTIPEGETAYFKVILLDPNGNEIPNATGDVDIVFTDGTAVRTGTSEDAELDFAANNQTVAINQVFSADALDDYLSDSGETFDVAIVDGTYSDAERYENVEHDLTPVTTTIIDDGQPDTPEDPSDNVEPDAEVVLIKLFAADENGEVLRDVNGDYLLANAVNEGETANYVAYAFAEGTLAYNDNTLLAHQNGSVSVTFNDDTATGAEVDVTSDGTQDFQNTGQTVDLGVSFSTETFNDVINEGTEIYNVTIDQGSYLAGDTQSYETVLIDTTPVTTSINDTEVRVFVRIDPVVDTVGEGGELSYVLSIVDQFGNSVFVPAGSTIDVELEYTPGIPEATTDIDYTSIPLVTIAGSTSTTTFTLPTLDDYFAEGIENLNITITNVIDGNNVFENILPHTVVNQAPSDAISVTGTITDNPAQDTENPGTPGEPTDPDAPNDTPRYGPEDSVYVKIINNDTQAEGADLSHTVQLVDANGDPVTVAAGETITVTLTYVGSGVDAAEADDYVATTTVTIVGGTSETTFTNEALDDFFAENDEEYTVTIDTATQAQDTYENVALHTIANGAPSDAISVTGTITDNPAQDTENPGTPGEPTDPNDPNDTPRYGPEDSVYVKIINNDTQAEGAELSHTVQLVDANGDPVTVAAGETITITLTYQGSGTDAAEANDYVATTTVTIVGGTSETTFTNEALDDFFAENDEEYTVTIDTATQAQDTYENVALHTIANGAPSDAISVTGTITDNPAQDTENPGTPGEPTDPDAPNDTPSYGPEDSVYVKIINNDTQAEGADLSHTVQLVDANGDPVTVAAGETISVTLTYVGSGTDAAEADDYVATTTVTIVGGTSETTFTNEALDDFFAENDEEYTVTIDTATQAQNTYENVALHTIANGAPSDAISVTGTITDNPAQDTENPGTPGEPTDPDDPNDTPRYGPEDSVYVKIINNDTQAEGADLSHTVQLVDANGDPVTVAAGETITVTLTYVGSGADAAEADDYVATTTVTIVGGTSETTFTNEALDDFFAENDEEYTVTIDTATQAQDTYENVALHTLANGAPSDAISVTGTITDNPAQDTENPGTPGEPTDPDDPNDTPRYGPEDSVYVKIINNDTQAEGADLSHTVQLVDANGDPVTVAAGETITVTLTYVGSGVDAAEADDYVATTTVTIVGGTSETTFTNEALDDFFAENDEEYTVTIDTATQAQNTYENVALHTIANGASSDAISVTGTITDNPAQDTENPGTPGEPTDPDDPNDTPRYGPEDSVYVKIINNDTQAEGADLSHTVQLVDANGDPVTVAAGETITVTLTYVGSGADAAEADDYVATTTVTIVGGTSETTFTNEALDDFFAENDEEYTVTIDTATQAQNTYENVALHTIANGAPSDAISVTGTITDNPAQDTENPGTPGEPTDPDDPNDTPRYGPEDSVYVKIINNDTQAEGADLSHTVQLVDANGDPVTVAAGETITVTLTYVGSGADAAEADDYVATTTVTIVGGTSETTFTNEALDDFFAENDEEYTVTIDTATQAQDTYENVALHTIANGAPSDAISVTGTITDNPAQDTENPGTPGEPTDPDDPNDTPRYGPEDSVYVKIINNDTQAEGADLSHTVQLVDANGDPVTVAAGETITVTLTYVGSGADAAEADDYVATTTVTIVGGTSETTFTNEALDDFFAENDEEYTVTIDTATQAQDTYENVALHTIANGAPSDAISVTGTITDNPAQDTENPGTPGEPTDPDDPNDTPRYGPEDSVYVKIINNDTQAEGADLSHTVQLVDANGDPVTVAAGETITVTLTYVGSGADAAEADDYVATTTVTIVGGTSETTFTNEALDDFFAENDEEYTVTIDTATQAQDTYENVALHTIANGAPSDAISVTGTITDNPAQDTENPGTPGEPTDPDDPNDTPRYGPEDSVYVKIINNDTQAEGADLSHTVQLVDANGDPVTVAAGETITITLTYQGSGTDAAEIDDYVATTTVTIVGGTSETTFTNEALDDFFAENDEEYTVTIDTATQAQDTYENVALHTIANGAPSDAISVTGTITDNPAQDTENPGTPGEPTDPDDPNDTPRYGPEDSVYVKIINNDTQAEGADLSHTVQLVDANGDPVTVAAGETITITLTYVGSGADAAEANDYVATTTVTIVGGTSETDFTNEAIIDFLNENDEQYTITIDTVTQANGTYENVVPARDGATFDEGNLFSVTGTITNGMTVGTPDNAYVDEDQFVATDPTSTLTGTELDNGGVADPDGNSSSGATTLVNLTTVYDATEYEFQFEESLVLNSESDTDVSIPAAGSAELTSGGVTLEYVVSGNTFTAYAGAGRTAADKVFDIVMSNNTDDGGTDDAYVYTQYQNIDHPTADLATNPAVSDDTLTLTFGYRVVSTDINNSNESDILNFTVTVNDSLPENSPQSVSTNEDTAVTITISAEPFDNGIINIDNNKDGPQDIANGNSVDIYDADGNDLIGSLTNNGDGTVLFTPAANYNGQASFDYQVSDRDHDTASATVTINVLPIADGVTMQNDLTGANAIVAVEDNSNTNDSPSHTQTNFAIALGLVLPTVVDATDHTVTGTTTYDAIERQGLLYFVFDNTDGTNDGYLVGLDTDGDGVLDQTLFTLDSSNDGNSFSIYITDGDFHPTDLDNTGAIQLTQAEYAQLAISPIEDSHHNVDFTITTESHEVTDAGALLSPDVISSSSTQNVRVDLQAMTDPVTIELAVVNTTDTTVTLEDRQLADGAAGTDGQNDHINLTINEDENDGLGYVDLKAIILEQYGDLDGSENFRFEISSAADDGVQINVEGVGSRTISTTPVTFDFDVNDPYIRLTPPTNFSGDLSTISIRLIALDNDTDSTVTETETSDLVTLDVFVKPIADDVTLPDVTTVEDTAVKLFENIALTDTDGSESITTLLINNLPTGWVVKDHNGLILLTGNGTDDLSIDVATVGLANVQNYTITPPAHSSTDIALSVDVTVTDASTVDGTSESDVDTFNHTLNIEVTPFAERVDTNTDTLDADGTDDVTINPDHTYLTTNTGKEDGDNGAQVWFELGSIFAAETSNSLESHWSNEDDTNFAANAGTQFDSELTYAHLTLLSDTSGNYDDAGESVYAGGVYRYFDGTDYVVVNNSASGVDIPIEYLDSLEFIGPDQFAGDLKIKIEAKTVDYDEDGGSTNTQISGESYLRFTIDPVADDVTVAIKQSFGNEDAGRNVDGSVDVTSAANGIPLDVTVTTDDTDGSETYTIVLSDIPDGASIYYDGALISADSGVVNANITATNDAGGTWSVEIAEFDNAAAFNYIPVYNDNSDVTLTMSAQSIDGLDTGVALTNLAINVNVSGVADTPTHNATATNTITDTYSTSQNYNVIEHEDVGSVSLTSFFDSNNPGFSSADIAGGDGSETLFVKINLTSAQVSAGFSVSGAGVTMLTATSWLVASTDFANAQLNVPSNYSGEVDFSLDLQTVENDDLSGNTLGDSDFVNVPLSLLITPEAEGTVNQTATQNEDTAQILDFTFSGNGGPNESLTSIWINTESIPSDIQLVTTDHGTLTTTNNGVATWVELTVTNSVVETVTAEYLASGHDSDADYSFEFRYTVADTTVDGSAYTDITPDGDSYDAATIDYETATYNVTVNAVTDTATLTLGTITDNDGDGNTDLTYDAGSQTVTVTDNTVFGVPFTLTADDMVSEASNGQDIDGSERILGYVEVTGVPEGIDIVNGVYLGDIVDGNGNTTHTGRWRVAINDDLILDNAAGETNLIEFVVGRTSYVDINQLITIEVFHADNGAAVLSNTESFTLVIDGDTFGGTDGEDGVPMDIVVTPTPQDFVEDTPLTADQLLAVVDDAGSINDSSKYSITITNLSGATVTGMVNEGGFYSLTGEGDVNAVIASLQSIVITPNADQNINSPEQVAFDIVITTYGVDEHNAYTVNYTNGNELNIQPVTDQTTIEITGGGVSEDNATTFTIDLNNLADDGRNVLINNRLYIQVSDDGETENGSGNFGTFTFGDGSPLTGLTTINANDVQDEQSPANSLPPGSYYVIDVSSYNGTLDIRYTPPADQYGNEISLTAYALTQEDPDTVNSGYDTLTWLTSASQTTTVTPVNDGLTITPVMQGDEDAIALLSLGGVTLSDASESITGAVLRDVPFGYEVSLNGVALTGSISGEDADGNYLYDYNLNVSSEAELETVGIQRVGVEDFAGIITGLTLDVIAGESGVETAQSWPISVEFNPVADNLLNLTATKTLGDEYVWTAINLNANVKDADGSESLTVVFEGTGATALDNSAIFRLRDSNDAVTDIPSGDLTATFDAVLETWTIAGIPFDQLGDLEILYHAFDDDITVTVYTVDAVTGLPTDTLAVGETDVFNMSLDESQNIITGEEDNIIVTGDAGVTVDAGDGDDTITGGSGDDSITGGLGDDVITAGGGWDYVNFSGDIASYQFAYDFNTNTLTVSGPDGTDQIQGAEVLKFNGVSYQLKVGTTGNDTLDFIDSTKNLIIPGPGTDTVDANADDYIVAGDASSPTTAVLFSTLDDGSNGDVTPNDGQIIDGIIEGMYYETSSGLSGYTDELGGFKYYDGDTVTFSIGGVIIGTADAQDLLAESLFLQDLADVERTDLEDDYVQVMAVFLQSLDSEGNTAGGIQISSAARAAFSDITLNLSTASLADVNTLLVAQGYEPVDIETAMDHVMEMLIAETSLTEDDFVPFELQDEVVSADTLEAALFGDSIESSVTEANEADALITGASITDASINDTVEGTSRAMDNEGDVDDKAYLLVDDSLYLGESVILEAQIPNSETAEQGEAVDQGADVSLPSLSDLFEDDGQALPLPDVQNSEEDEVSISNASSDNAAADTTVVTYQDLEDSFKIDDSQSDF